MVAAAAIAGCGNGADGDPLQVAEVLRAATPAASPPVTAQPAGLVLPVGREVSATVVEPASRTLAVALRSPDRVQLYDLDDLDVLIGAVGNGDLAAVQPRTVELPGPVEQLDLGVAGEILAPVPSAGRLLRIDAEAATARETALDGGPTAAAVVGDRTVVALGKVGAVVVLDGDRITHTVTGFAQAADVVAVDDRAAILDRLRTSIVTIDPATGEQGPALRAGNGATNSAADRFGRVLVTDTRDGELLAFSADPMIMRQRYPVPGVPYAIAYDSARDLAWVTLTERNEVVGLDVAGGEPVERYRLPTVRQPNAVAVDPDSGTVVVASGSGEGMQVVRP